MSEKLKAHIWKRREDGAPYFPRWEFCTDCGMSRHYAKHAKREDECFPARPAQPAPESDVGQPGVVHEIIPGRLFLSGCRPSMENVSWEEVNAIVNVGDADLPWLDGWKAHVRSHIAIGQPRLAVYLKATLIDAENFLDPHAAEAAAGLVLRVLEDPERRVLVHCDMGAFRSVLVASLVLATSRGLSGTDARKEVHRRMGREPQEKWMHEFDDYLSTLRAPTEDNHA